MRGAGRATGMLRMSACSCSSDLSRTLRVSLRRWWGIPPEVISSLSRQCCADQSWHCRDTTQTVMQLQSEKSETRPVRRLFLSALAIRPPLTMAEAVCAIKLLEAGLSNKIEVDSAGQAIGMSATDPVWEHSVYQRKGISTDGMRARQIMPIDLAFEFDYV